MNRTELTYALKAAFTDLRIVKPGRMADKYEPHYDAIADFMLSLSGSLRGFGMDAEMDAYSFARELVSVARLHGCKFVTPAVCSNRDKMKEASQRFERGATEKPEQVNAYCLKLVAEYQNSGLYGDTNQILVNPQLGFPAWFRVAGSGFNKKIVSYYMEEAREELAGDKRLSEYLLARFPRFLSGTGK